MTKKELLNKLAQKEYDWLKSLDNHDFCKEYNEWFNLDEYNSQSEDDDMLEENRPILYGVYVDDYMRYREDESVDELLELLN